MFSLLAQNWRLLSKQNEISKQMSFFLSIIFDTTKLFTKDNHAILKMIDQSNTKLLNICKLNLSFIFYSDKHLY